VAIKKYYGGKEKVRGESTPNKPKYDKGSQKRQTPDRKLTHKYDDKGDKNVGMSKKRMKHGKAGGRKSTTYKQGHQTQGFPTANNTYSAGE